MRRQRLEALTPLNHPRPLLFGVSVAPHKGCTWPLGGSGYVLNRAALDNFGSKGIQSFLPETRDPREDVFIGSWFCSQGIYVADTRDENGANRFWFTAEMSSKYSGRSLVNEKEMKRLFNIDIPLGMYSASDQQIAFHLRDDKDLLSKRNYTVADQIYHYHSFFSLPNSFFFLLILNLDLKFICFISCFLFFCRSTSNCRPRPFMGTIQPRSWIFGWSSSVYLSFLLLGELLQHCHQLILTFSTLF